MSDIEDRAVPGREYEHYSIDTTWISRKDRWWHSEGCEMCLRAPRINQMSTHRACRLLLSPAYWEAMHDMRIVRNGSVAKHIGYIVSEALSGVSLDTCDQCNQKLAEDERKLSEYGLAEYVPIMMSEDERPGLAAAIVAGVTWKKITGKWPASVGFRDATVAKRFGAAVVR